MIRPWPGIALVLATFVGMAAALKAVERSARPHPELTRKLMHVGMGTVVLSFPWLFARPWPVLLLAGVTMLLLLAVKRWPEFHNGIGSVVTRVQRPTFGEVYFPIAVGLLFWLGGPDPLLFCVPMLIVTFADTLAATVGIAYGRTRYRTPFGIKSVEGSTAFLVVAFLCVHVPLLLSGRTGRDESLLIAAVIAVASTLIEAVAWRGLDNLAVPLVAFALLRGVEHRSTAGLLPWLMGITLVALALLVRRRRTA